MTAHLFYFQESESADLTAGSSVELRGEEFKHALVRRIEVGEEVLLANGNGQKYRASVQNFGKDSLECEITEALKEVQEQEIIVAQALAKGGRDEMAVEICTELGATAFIPWQAERSIVKWDAKKEKKQSERWKKIALNAAKQSRRSVIPTIEGLAKTKGLLQASSNVQILVLHEDATEQLSEVSIDAERSILLVIGPEGGISDAELKLFEEAGGTLVSVSPHVLRTSTAGAAALAQLVQ